MGLHQCKNLTTELFLDLWLIHVFLGSLGFTSLVVYTTKVPALRMSKMVCVEGYTEHV